MRVILGNRATSPTVLGGDAIQQRKTGEALERLGVEVVLAHGEIKTFKGIDLVHLFNIIPVENTLTLFKQAKAAGVPVVLSPIYWDATEFLMHTQSKRERDYLEWWQRTRGQRLLLVREADYLLPNGVAEAELLIREFGTIAPYQIVPNAADKIFYYGNPERFRRRYKQRKFILCVGRICRRKNQLSLIRALQNLDIDLVFVGPVDDYPYYRECRNEKTRCHVHFIDTMDQYELSSVYAAAEVQVLPSWYETPGLASLEAALAGCKIVTTGRGTAREYFGDAAWYCEPGDLDSIRLAVQNALSHPVDRGLREKIRQNYNWDRVGRLTLTAYQHVLGLKV